MWYTYFKFYTDETTIKAGLDQYCTEWENMYQIGYNYREYKCFVDNVGGFEHWVGDLGGYMMQTRETSFVDGSPSDGVFDQTLLMGTTRVIASQVEMLAGFGLDAVCYLRKLTAKDAGAAHEVNFKIGASQKVKHPVMYTFDSSQVEMFKMTTEIIDSSDVDEYEIMVDVNRDYMTAVPTVYSNVGVTVADIGNMVDGDYSTYCRLTGAGSVAGQDIVIFDMGQECDSFGLYGHAYTTGTNPYTKVKIYISNDLSGWTKVVDISAVDETYAAGKLAQKYRYLKFDFYQGGTVYNYKCDVFMLIRR